ncbi:helix-turn-helix transcriptional regulator [Pseudoteredinibacter isoporae]|uniref:AraC-like DNA-binding protein n=1 Tax=Pseudoteredinibacter isoporae TaxID=570281 RepID=A0A7X0MU71_9GAMM|nr:AraC family transcriptional regulator [Pseudoteredinibacter isoporae]MBB6520321.1 AraC-like DNA-binding protein [Pseudoteredinibacter isoporae]NHO85892.1 AraC family transcriptional regulator [Pseudoteredinibacter isoporae]NIB25656.1 AraC family transcriptional regulator [Pseudoteredinibacter isoporae]
MRHFHITNLWISGVFAGFERLGLDRAALMAGISSANNYADNSLNPGSMELGDARRLWHRAEELSENTTLGAQLGLLQNQRASGVLMPICWHSPTPIQAFQHIASFQSLISDNGLYRIRDNEKPGLTVCEYVPSAHSVPPNRQQILSVITGTILVLRAISPQDPVLAVGIPEDMAHKELSKLLDVHVTPASPYFSLHLDSNLMQLPIEGRDEHLYEINLAYAEGMIRHKREGKSLREDVKQMIEQGAPAQVTIEDVARELDVNKRVLQRLLAEQGSSFRQLKESLLKEKALALLITERWEISAIAQELGYSEVSAFHRAFKSWFSASPKQFRDTAMA